MALLLGGAAVLWSTWPGISPSAGGSQEVITVFVEDPWRMHEALRLWRQRPGALLVMQGRPSSQEQVHHHLESRDLWPVGQGRVMVLTPGCDTVGQLRALTEVLNGIVSPGRVTVVTSEAHLARSVAIARILLGGRGWRVEGLPVVGHDNRPEHPWRLHRDRIRAQLWRATGWEGGLPDQRCP
jgi:uncharacterized SAM-binding protein YcdF (DUF218 family)